MTLLNTDPLVRLIRDQSDVIWRTSNSLAIAQIAARIEEAAAKIKTQALADALFEVRNGKEAK